MHLRLYVCMCIYIYTHVCVCMYVSMYVCTYVVHIVQLLLKTFHKTNPKPNILLRPCPQMLRPRRGPERLPDKSTRTSGGVVVEKHYGAHQGFVLAFIKRSTLMAPCITRLPFARAPLRDLNSQDPGKFF